MLEMRPCCERCGRDLPADAAGAYICSFECTFCGDCTLAFPHGQCPNCGGDVQPRPRRVGEMLLQHPASQKRIVKP